MNLWKIEKSPTFYEKCYDPPNLNKSQETRSQPTPNQILNLLVVKITETEK